MQWAERQTVPLPFSFTIAGLPDLRGRGRFGITEDLLSTADSIRRRVGLEQAKRRTLRRDIPPEETLVLPAFLKGEQLVPV